MPVLKSLTFTSVPVRSHDPVAVRRAKLVSRLEEQRLLLQNPSYVRTVQRWAGKGDERRQVEKQQRVRPWWRTDSSGNLVMSVFYGAKPIEFEKGKAGIAVASRDKLPALVDALVGAAKAGELDELMARMGKPVGAPKSRKRGLISRSARAAEASPAPSSLHGHNRHGQDDQAARPARPAGPPFSPRRRSARSSAPRGRGAGTRRAPRPRWR